MLLRCESILHDFVDKLLCMYLLLHQSLHLLQLALYSAMKIRVVQWGAVTPRVMGRLLY